MRSIGIAGLALLSTSVLAASVVAELSARSHIPEPELEQILSNCDATQLSMNICAFRDFVEADMRLKEMLSGFHSQCIEIARIEQGLWEQQRDVTCNKEADDEAEGGSMRPMIFSSCRARSTTERVNILVAKCARQQGAPADAPKGGEPLS